jgi:PAS domain S-box-containing protein
MTPPPVCILYAQDADLLRRIKAFLSSICEFRHVAEADRLNAVLQQTSPAVLIIDLRAKEALDLVEDVQQSWPEVLIIALGVARSEPLREAERSGVYAADDLQTDRRRLQSLVTRAFDHLRLMQENRSLREESALVPMAERQVRAPEAAPLRRESPTPLLRFPRVFRRFDNVEALLASVVEGVADATGVGRIGIFSRMRQGDRYRLRAGLRCLPETYDLEYGERDPLVRWFELHAHLIARANLTQASVASERALMRRALDTFGAEAIVPLHARGRIIGWLFFGHRVTGQPFDYTDLEGLMLLAEHVSTVLENALLNEEITVQKTLAETLLKSMPLGIVATDEEAVVRWFNPAAEQILGVRAADALNKPVEMVGNRVAAALRDTLDSRENVEQQWKDPQTHRSLSVETRRLADARTPLGAVAVIHDMTGEENLREKQQLVERAQFWTDLAASMSHEVRNPLVAIKTFAQLLPERFDDADFRRDFNEIVVQEIDRLDKIITQINNFAHPSELVMKPIDVREPVKRAIDLARERLAKNGVAIDAALPPDLPKVIGDETALTEAFAHLVTNAAEAAGTQPKPRVTLAAKSLRQGDEESGVIVTVQDNGKGIPADLREKVFSPFCTTKPRGMGLGLPIVKRTVFDHNGRVDIESDAHGTSVNVILPASTNGH